MGEPIQKEAKSKRQKQKGQKKSFKISQEVQKEKEQVKTRIA